MENYNDSIVALLNKTANRLHLNPTGSSLEEVYASLFHSDDKAFTALLEIAGDKKSSRIYAIRALRGLRDRKAVKPLIQLLQAEDNDVIIGSILTTLGEIGDSEAIPVINKIILHEQEGSSTLQDALESLLNLPQSTTSIDCLCKVILEGDIFSTKVEKAVIALKKIEDPKAVEALINLIENKLSQSSYKDELTYFMDQAYYYEFISEKMGFTALLDSTKWISCFPQIAIAALFDLKEEYACEPFLNMLNSKNENIRIIGILALGKFTRKQVVNQLLELLSDKEIRIQKAAIESLGSIRDKNSIPQLIELLKIKDKSIKDASAMAINSITGKKYFFGNSSYKKWHNWYFKFNS